MKSLLTYILFPFFLFLHSNNGVQPQSGPSNAAVTENSSVQQAVFLPGADTVNDFTVLSVFNDDNEEEDETEEDELSAGRYHASHGLVSSQLIFVHPLFSGNSPVAVRAIPDSKSRFNPAAGVHIFHAVIRI